MMKLFYRTLLEMDQAVYPCHLSIGTGCFEGFRVNVIALDIGFNF